MNKNKRYIFLSNMSLFLKKGYTFDEAVYLCKDFIDDRAFNGMKSQLEEGIASYHIIMSFINDKDFIKYFTFFSSHLKVSESIDKTLEIMNTQNSYKQKIIKKLSYPSLLILFLIVFSAFIYFFLLPKVNMLFISFHIQRSFLMNIIFNLFSLIPVMILSLLLFSLLFIGLLILSIKRKKLYIVNKYMKLNIIRKCLRFYFSFKFACYYNEFIKEKMDNREVIKFLCDELNDYDIKFIFYEVLLKMNKGSDMYNAVIESYYLEDFFIKIMKMRTLNNNDILQLYIKLCSDKIDYYINRITNIIVPAIYIFVGGYVISAYVSIILPMMNIMSEI